MRRRARSFLPDAREEGVSGRADGSRRRHCCIGHCASSARLSSRTLTTRFTQKPQLPALGVCFNRLPDRTLGDAALAGHARHLEIGSRRRQMRIEAGRGRRDEIDRHGVSGVLLTRGLDVRLHRVDQLLVGRPELAACRVRRVIRRARRRWTRSEVAGSREALADEARSHDRTIALEQLPVRVVAETAAAQRP